jgi:hypothetical protein
LLLSGLFTGAYNVGETLRTNILDAADAVTGTGKYRHDEVEPARGQLPSEQAGARSISTTSGPSAGIGAGNNPMRATGITDDEAANVGSAQRGQAVLERDTTTSAAGAHTGAGAGLPSGTQSAGPAVAGAAPAGPGMLGGAVV